MTTGECRNVLWREKRARRGRYGGCESRELRSAAWVHTVGRLQLSYTAVIQTDTDTTVMALHCQWITCHAPDGQRNELLQTFVSRADKHILTPVVQFKVVFLCTRCEVFAIVILNPTWLYMGECGHAVGWDTALQNVRLRVLFPMAPLEFFIDMILLAT
jgi:hypothetical protein